MKYKAAIFDMDGTILNTADDLTAAVNYAMGQCGHKDDFTAAQGALLFGSGVRTALQRALSIEAGREDPAWLLRIGTPDMADAPGVEPAEIDRIEAIYRPYYLAHSMNRTRPYDGIPALLRKLREIGCRAAVVSNKPDPAVAKLAAEVFGGLFDMAIGEQMPAVRRKPAPDMVVSALDRFGMAPGEALYIGDSEIDIETARNAGLDCAAVSWGFRTREFLEALGPSYMVDAPARILPLITGEDA